MQQPVVAIAWRAEVLPVGRGGSRTFVLGVLGVDPFHLKWTVADGHANAAARLKVNEIFPPRLGQAEAIVHKILARNHPIKALRLEEIPDALDDVMARLDLFGQVHRAAESTGGITVHVAEIIRGFSGSMD